MTPLCGLLMSQQFKRHQGRRLRKPYLLRATMCSEPMQAFYLCELPEESQGPSSSGEEPPSAPSSPLSELSAPVGGGGPATSSASVTLVACPKGHVTHTFLACDVSSTCWDSSSSGSLCAAPLTPLPPLFECANGVEAVPYALVCDFRFDCRDSSDENFCDYPPCSHKRPLPCGRSGQVLRSV